MVGRPPAWRSLWTSAAASRGGCTLTILSIFSSVLSVKLIISKKGGKGQGNRDAPYNIIMFTIMLVTITIIIAGGKRGDGNASLHIRSNVGLSKRSHSFTLNPRETGAHCSILAHICYFVCSWSSRAKPPTCRSSGLSTPGTGLRRTVCFTALASGRPTDSSTHCRWFSPDFLLFFGDGFDFFYFASQLYFILFSGSPLNGCKNNPHAPVRPTQGECLLIFFNDNDGKNRKMFDWLKGELSLLAPCCH